MTKLGINNPLLDADSYKASHSVQYPPGTQYVYSYIESRGGINPETVFFGLQMFLKKYWSEPICKIQIDEAEREWTAHGEPFDRKMWDYIVDFHDGWLPLEIRAVPEGSVIPNKNVLLTITNTDPKCAAAVSFFETALLRAIWYPTTVASNSRALKKILKKYLLETADNADGLPFKLHDFGARGVSSKESSGVGGAGHLVNFMGTDTFTAVQYIKAYYHEPMAGFSIPAGEHSTVTTWGRDGEAAYLKNLIKQSARPNGLVACPIDSYDTWNFCDNVIKECLDDIIRSKATFVARPDSGNPLDVPVRVISRLGTNYGATKNTKGYKILPSYLRVIQGDGINPYSLPEILENVKKAGYSTDNIAFGCGGGLLQEPNRDDYKFAMKASAAYIDQKWVDVFKNPIDQPDKASKKGRFILIKRSDGTIVTSGACEYDIVQASDMLQPVWKNGKLLRDMTFAQVRKNAEV